MKFNKGVYFLIVFIILIATVAISISIGPVNIPLKEILNIFRGSASENSKTIILNLRLPRVIASIITGMGLSVVGTFFQGLLRNPMADPYILGISAGSAFGATIAIILGFGILGLNFMAFVSSLISVLFVYTIAKSNTRISMTTMILAGTAVSTFISAIISFMMLLNNDKFTQIIFWTMGGFKIISWDSLQIAVPIIVIGTAIMYVFSRDINAILTGEEIAQHLGINTEMVKKIILITGSLVTAASVSIGGIIGFVGLIIPHICRIIVGPDNRILFPFSAISGAIFLTFADTLARIVLKPTEVPVGIITAIFGGPFFLYLLARNKRKNERM